MFAQRVTMLVPRGTVTDTYGNVLDDWTNPTQLVLRNVLVAPRTSSDATGPERNGVVIGLSIYLRSTSTVIPSNARFVIDGRTYELEGEAAVWQRTGVEVALKRVEG